MSAAKRFSFLVTMCGVVSMTWAGEAVTTRYDYVTALHDSILFYEAQRSGPLPATNRISWRGDSALQDGADVGVDLTGGWYDAGDNMKLGFPMAWSTTVLTWGFLDYTDAYFAAGEYDYMLDCIKWPLDYFIKAHSAPTVLWGQVGLSPLDHTAWVRPEDMTMKRPAFQINETCPGSDLAGETAAAMAAGSIAFKTEDEAYSATLLTHAKQLYDFAYNYRGKYSDCITDAAGLYKSANYYDELCWGAAWLYRATMNSTYLTKAMEYKNDRPCWGFSWGSKGTACRLLLYQLTGDKQFTPTVEAYIKQFMGAAIPQTPRGLAFRSEWGSLRYAANSAFLALHAANYGILPAEGREWAVKQINYALGDTGRSFVVGFGVNPPQRPHHRASSCPSPPRKCKWKQYRQDAPNPHVLTGAVVGGPNASDSYVDDRTDYKANEVACDYNAGFQSALAAILDLLF